MRTRLLTVVLSSLLACAVNVRAYPGHDRVKHHHVLLGKIVKVEPERNELTMETNNDRAVVCIVDSKTVIKRDGRKISLGEIRAGERVRCHCAAITGGKHYSQQLQLESK